MALLEAILHGKFEDWTASSMKFGKVRIGSVTPSNVMGGAIVLGIVSGLMGPFFINVNTRVNAVRAMIWKKKWHKPIDTFIFAFMTATCFYWFPYMFRSCISRTILNDGDTVELKIKLDKVVEGEEEQNVY